MKRFIFLITLILSISTNIVTAQLQWNILGKLKYPRHFHNSLYIGNNKVLVMGGYINSNRGMSGTPTQTCEIIDVAKRTVSLASPMNYRRTEFVALRSVDSSIIVISGLSTGALTPTCERYNRTTESWEVIGSLLIARHQHTAIFINDNEILVVGGRNQNTNSNTISDAEIFNIVTGKSRMVANFPYLINLGSSNIASNGDILVGAGRSGGPDSYKERNIYKYNVSANSWTSSTVTADAVGAAHLLKLRNGKLLCTGGAIIESTWNYSNQVLIEKFGHFYLLGRLLENRSHHVAEQWNSDSAIVMAGYHTIYDKVTDECEWINLSTGLISKAPKLNNARAHTSAVAIPLNGTQSSTILIISGINSTGSDRESIGMNDSTIEILEQTIAPIAHFAIDSVCEGESIKYLDTSKNYPKSWEWTFEGGIPSTFSGQTPPPIRYFATGSYTTKLIVKNSLGSDTLQQIIVVHPRPTANAGPDKLLCEKDSVQIGTSAKNGFTYHWFPATGLDNPNKAQPQANPLGSLKYYLTVKNESGCESYDTVQVVRSPVVIANAGKDVTICPGNFVDIGSNPQNSNDIYSWSPSTGLNSTTFARPTANPLETTRYYLTVTNKYGCSSVDSVLVSVGEIVASVTPDTSVCHGSGVILTASGGSEYEWSPSDGLSASTGASVTASPLETTVYQIIAKSGDCRDTAFLKLTVLDVPTADAGSDKEICAGESVELGAASSEPGLKYQWTPSEGLLKTDVANPIATPLRTTEYIVEVTNESGCKARDTMLVTVREFLKVMASNDTAICAGESVPLSAVSDDGVIFKWTPETGLDNPNISKPTATPTQTTTYTVTAFKNAGLCSAVDSVRIEVLKLPEVTAKDITLCEGETAELSAQSDDEGVTWSWTPTTGLSNPNIQNPIVTAFKSQVYTVTATNKSGCTAFKTLSVTVTEKEDITGVLKSDKAELGPGESTLVRLLLKTENSAGITSFKALVHFDANVFQFTKNSGKFLNGADNTWFLQADIIAPGELEIEANGQTPIASSVLSFELTAYLAKQTTEDILLKLTEINGEVLIEEELCRMIETEGAKLVLKEVCAGDMRLVNVGEFQTVLQQITPNPVTNETIEINYSVGIEGEITLEMYNSQGELVKTIFKGNQKTGVFKETFSTEEIPAGVFLVKLSTVQTTQTQIFNVVK